MDRRTNASPDRPTNHRTNRPTDTAGYRDALSHLKTSRRRLDTRNGPRETIKWKEEENQEEEGKKEMKERGKGGKNGRGGRGRGGK